MKATMTVQAYVNQAWLDITEYVVVSDNLTMKWGMSDNTPFSRVAGTGTITFSLDNTSKYFSPISGSALTGFSEGTMVVVTLSYGCAARKYLARISSIKPIPDRLGKRLSSVVCVDLIDNISKYPIVNPAIQINKTAGSAIQSIVSLLPIQPQATDYSSGVTTFPTVYDAVTTRTKAISEINKLTMSEFGFFYIKKDSTYGETVVFEGNHDRTGLDTLGLLPKCNEPVYIQSSDGINIQASDGTNLISNEYTTYDDPAIYSDTMSDPTEIDHGKNIINYLTVNAYPPRYDTSNQVLFKLNSVIQVASGDTVTIKGNYINPSGGNPIAGSAMINPVAGSANDYNMNASSTGSGTDITAYLVPISIVNGAEGFTHTYRNTYTGIGYIDKYQCRGLGVYKNQPISYVSQSTYSQNIYGSQENSLDQKYQVNLNTGKVEADKIINSEKKPRQRINKISFWADRDEHLMYSMLTIDVGSLVQITESQTGSNAWYHVQGVEIIVKPGGQIMFSWILREFLCLSMGLSMVSCCFSGSAASDGIDYGKLPQVQNLTNRTMEAWIYLNADTTPTGNGGIISIFGSDSNGVYVATTSNNRIKVWIYGTGHVGTWTTPNSSLTKQVWTNVIVERDNSSESNIPVVYINGVAQSLTESDTFAGTIPDESGCNLYVGNILDYEGKWSKPFNGKIYDPRVYNRLLSAAEAVTRYNSGTPDKSLVKSGLVFQGGCIPTFDANHFIDYLYTDPKVTDNIYGCVGSLSGSPTIAQDSLSLTPINVDFQGTTDGIEFGHVAEVTDLTTKSISFWEYIPADDINPGYPISFHDESYTSGWRVQNNNGYLSFGQQYTGGSLTSGYWHTSNGSIYNAWAHYVVTYTSGSANDPIMYINGTSGSITELITPSNSVSPESTAQLIVGNINVPGYSHVPPYTWNKPAKGKIQYMAIYNRILSAAEVTTLYNGGTPSYPSITNGLVFAPMNVIATDLAQYQGKSLNTRLKLFDSINYHYGTPHGAPVGG